MKKWTQVTLTPAGRRVFQNAICKRCAATIAAEFNPDWILMAPLHESGKLGRLHAELNIDTDSGAYLTACGVYYWPGDKV